MQLNAQQFADLLAACTRSAVHLEMRDSYSVAGDVEHFRAWQTGERYDLADRESWWNSFHTLISGAVNRGVQVRRARIVSEPVTEYIRYEHSLTPQNIVAGEDVRWLPRAKASDLALPGNDFWLFDGRVVRFPIFSGDGELVDRVIDDGHATVELCAKAFEAVWERATPHDQYEIR